MKQKTKIQEWAAAKNSGGYIHPETQKNMPNIPPRDTPEPDPTFTPDNDSLTSETRTTWFKRTSVGFLLVALLGGAYYLGGRSPVKNTWELPVSEIWDYWDSRKYWEPTFIQPQRPVVIPDSPVKPDLQRPASPRIPSWKLKQDRALARIEAWERLNRHLIDRFYDTPTRPNRKRRLCLTLRGVTDCTERPPTIDSKMNQP